MYQTFSLRFMVAASKMCQDGLAPLFLSIIVDNKRVSIQLKKKLKPSDFNVKTQTATSDDVNNYIAVVRSRMLNIQTELFAQKIVATPQKIKDLFNDVQSVKQWGLIELYELHNEDMKKLVGKTVVASSYMKHTYVLSYLKTYMKNIDRPITDINASFIKGLYNYLIDVKNHQHNTAVGCMKKVKKIFNAAFADSIITQNPFNSISYKLDKTTPTFLTEYEITKIWEKKFTNVRIEQVRDIYIFNCLTGLSYIDSKFLTKDFIFTDGDGCMFIRKPRQKTNVTATIPLNKVAVSILEKYNYNLPVISNQRMNAYLKEIQDICGINKTLTTHTARHSAATMLLNRGVSLSTVSAVLGHSNQKITTHYAKLLDTTIMNEIKGINLLSK